MKLIKQIIRQYLSESDDSLEWAEDIVNSMPELPIVDGQRRVVRSNNNLTSEYLESILHILSKNGYSFRSGNIIYQANQLLTILGNGGYLHLHPNGRLTHGSDEWTFIDVNDGTTFSDVPNIFI